MKRTLVVIMLIAAMTMAGCGCGSAADEPVQGTESMGTTEQTETAEIIKETETVEMTEAETQEVTGETEMAGETEAIEETETIAVEEPAYTITEMSAVKYARSSVNVRKGPSTDYEKAGSLVTNQEVKVTGQADTGWYRIELNGEEVFVSNNYLVDEKVVIPVTQPSDNSASSTGTTDTGSESASVPESTPTPESTQAAQPDNTPTPEQPAVTVPENNESADNGGSNGSSEMTQEQIDEIKQEFADNPDITVEADGTINIGGLGTGEPTTDGYGDGTTITVGPVQ